MVNKIFSSVTIRLILPLLFLALNAHARESKELKSFDFHISTGLMKGLESSEGPNTNIARTPSLSVEASLSYSIYLSKHFRVSVGVGEGRYAWKYRSNLTLNGPHLSPYSFDLKFTPAIYCPTLSVSVEKEIELRETMVLINGGIMIFKAPSMFQGNSYSFEDSLGQNVAVFSADFLFNHEIVPVLFLKLGFPIFKSGSRLSAFVKLTYALKNVGSGTFDITNTTSNSHGSATIDVSGVNFELRCRLSNRN